MTAGDPTETAPRLSPRARRLLWLDSLAALVAGAAVLAVAPWLAGLEQLPVTLVVALAVVNLAYGTYSGTLVWTSRRRIPARVAIDLLVALNLGWGVACAVILALHAGHASLFAWLHLGLEGVFVAGLGLTERRIVRPEAA